MHRQPFRRSLTLNQTHPNLPLSILHLDETDVNINKNEEKSSKVCMSSHSIISIQVIHS